MRGLSASTVAQHLATIQNFLQEALPNGSPISALTRECIDQHMVTTGRRISRQSLQHWVAHLRSFLRFCRSSALLAQPLAGCAPSSAPGCVFRIIVTDRFGIVTAEFGNVTDHFGDVTDAVSASA